MGELLDALELRRTTDDSIRTEQENERLDHVIYEAAKQVANAVPVFRMGGLSPAYYITVDPDEADAWLIEVKPKEL